ncbi:MAG: glycosyltransferase family 4 protein [Dehalococcoidia bacterium]
MKRLRILIASDSFPPKIDGVSDTAATIARNLSARGHRVHVVAPSPGPEAADGFRITRLRSVPFPIYPELRLSFELDRIRRLARRPWDGAIVLTPGPIGATTMASVRGDTVALNVYTTDIPGYLRTYSLDPLSGPVESGLRYMAKRARTTLCPTVHVAEDLRRRKFPRTEIWGRGVDTALFHPGRRSPEMRERLSGGESSKPVALYVGRLAREKQIMTLSGVIPVLPDVRFAFVGDGPERERLEAQFAGLPVVFTGYLRGEELAAAYASADIFVFPSASETFGQVVIQAMASGLVPLVARGSATAELVPNGIAGLHVDPGCPQDSIDAIASLVNDPARRASMAAAAVNCASRYSWDALVSRLEELIREPHCTRPAADAVGASRGEPG